MVSAGCAVLSGKVCVAPSTGPLYESLVLLVALQHGYTKLLSVGGHLRNFNKGELDYQVDLTGALQRYRSVNLAILLREPHRCEGRILKLNIHFSVQGFDSSEPIYLLKQTISF